MEKFIIISDSFKGTMSSSEIADIFEVECKNIFPDSVIKKYVIADGGEGSISSFKSFIKGNDQKLSVCDSYFNLIDVSYFISDDNVAIIEVASSSGLPQVKIKNPSLTSTFGVGEQIKDAISKGCKKIILCLGGSSTNDAGCGLFSALGVKFYDENNNTFIPVGKTLNHIKSIDTSLCDELLKDISIVGMCDINNPMYGINGAAYKFARQKGADDEMIKMLDDNLKYLADFIKVHLRKEIYDKKGSGAAGAIGAGLLAFSNASLKSGIDTLLSLSNFDKDLIDCDYVFTGEGRLDEQSFNGKVLSGILSKTTPLKKKVISVCGSIDDSCKQYLNDSNSLIDAYSILKLSKKSLNEIMKNPKHYYSITIKKVLKSIKNNY